MARIVEKHIVGKGQEWMKSSRPDLLEIPMGNLFSVYLNDAKEFDTRKEAKQKAKKVGGDVWLFIRATGYHEKVWTNPPDGAKCGGCRRYTGWDGECKNPHSEHYKTPVSVEDSCDEWEEPDAWMKKTD